MSRLGDPYDNAVMESFYKTLKRELMPETRKFTSEKEARNAIFEYIEMFYNTYIKLPFEVVSRSHINVYLNP